MPVGMFVEETKLDLRHVVRCCCEKVGCADGPVNPLRCTNREVFFLEALQLERPFYNNKDPTI